MDKLKQTKLRDLLKEITVILMSESDQVSIGNRLSSFDFSALINLMEMELKDVRIQKVMERSATRTAAKQSAGKSETSQEILPAKIIDAAVPVLQTADNAVCIGNQSMVTDTTPRPQKNEKPRSLITRISGNVQDAATLSDKKQSKISWAHLVIGTTLTAIFLFAAYSLQQYMVAAQQNESSQIDKNKTMTRPVSSYPTAVGHSKKADEAFKKGQAELLNNNPAVAREYFRLALTIEPGSKAFLKALSDAEELFKTPKKLR